MELDDLKNTWEDISNQVNKKNNLNTQIIDQMTKKKYHSNLKKIAYPEFAGVLVCLMGAIYIGFNFGKLDTYFLQITGAVSILLLLTLSALSLLSLHKFTRNIDLNKSYAETLKDFAVQKLQFHKFQKVNVTLSYLLLVTTIILFSKFFAARDITDSKYFWTFSFSLGYIFLLFYSKWVAKYYKNTLRQTEELLKELAA